MASLLGVHRITLYKVLRQQEEPKACSGPLNGTPSPFYGPKNFFAWSIRNRKTSPHILVCFFSLHRVSALLFNLAAHKKSLNFRCMP